MILAISSSQFSKARQNPELFQDGLVKARAEGYLLLQLLSGQRLDLRVFEAPADFGFFQLHEPVAYHSTAEILATGELWTAVKLYGISVP